MGGLSGFVGTYLIGPRIGLFNNTNNISYINDDEKMIQEQEGDPSSSESEHTPVNRSPIKQRQPINK